MSEFKGFPDDLFDFQAELLGNNNREWFHANKARYEASVRGPALAFIRTVGERLGEVTPHLEALDKKVGGSLMRVYRDTRFSKDKTPYKTNVGIQFRHRCGKDVHAPGLYLHISLEEFFIGAGMWTPDSPSLKLIRTKIDEEQDRWLEIIGGIDPEARHGVSLKRGPRGFPKDHPLLDELKRKSHLIVTEYDPDLLSTTAIVDTMIERLQAAKPMMTFLCEAVDQPF